jgi:hypothetical protein
MQGNSRLFKSIAGQKRFHLLTLVVCLVGAITVLGYVSKQTDEYAPLRKYYAEDKYAYVAITFPSSAAVGTSVRLRKRQLILLGADVHDVLAILRANHSTAEGWVTHATTESIFEASRGTTDFVLAVRLPTNSAAIEIDEQVELSRYQQTLLWIKTRGQIKYHEPVTPCRRP